MTEANNTLISGEYKYCHKCGARMLERLSISSNGMEREAYNGKLNYCPQCGTELRGEKDDKKSANEF